MNSWIVTKLLGYRRIFLDGKELPERGAINLVGFTATDNPVTERTDVGLWNGVVAGALEVSDVETDNLLANAGIHSDGPVVATAGMDVTGGVTVAGGVSSDHLTFTTNIAETRIQQTTPHSPTDGWGPVGGAIWRNTTAGDLLQIPINPPHGVELQSAMCLVDPLAHASWPITAPKIEVKYFDTSTLSIVSLGAARSDDVTFQAVYEAAHWLASTSMTHIVDRTSKRYWIELTAEAGANAVTGTLLLATKLTWTRPAGSRAAQD